MSSNKNFFIGDKAFSEKYNQIVEIEDRFHQKDGGGNIICTFHTTKNLLGSEFEKDLKPVKEEKEPAKSAFDTQVQGSHYKDLKIQPMEYCLANKLNYGQSNAIKYITRYKNKNGQQDLEKAIHCIQLLMEYEYGQTE